MLSPARPAAPLIEASGALRDRALARAPQAEWGLAYQGARVLLDGSGSSGWLARRAGRRLVALGLPLGAPDLAALGRTAAASGLSPLLYKCDAATACLARRAGWSVLRLGDEAVLDFESWSLDRPACRQLRRKLRATAGALRMELATRLPLAAMEEVARDWARRSGRERGFSMGRLDPALLRHQRVLLAWQGEALVAFASFHAGAEEWTLDLMRHREGAPNGTMHRLVVEAAALARAEGTRRLSLAAIPTPPRLSFGRAARPCGLQQFKLSFGPRLLPRYAAAPGGPSLLAGLAQVAWAVHRPAGLGDAVPGRAAAGRFRRGVRRVLAPRNFGFEPGPVPCDAPRAVASTGHPP
jgi:phosphatidylglycerol lysyltransferase